MTVPATVRKAGPFNGAGTITPYPFSFKIFATTDVQLTQADTLGNTTVLSSGYSVTMNPDQVALPGGSVTLTTALPTGYKLTILGNLPYDQTLSIPGGGNFDPVSLEKELDRTIMQVQQIAERNDRAVSSAATDSLSSGELPGAQAGAVIGWDPTGTKLVNLTPGTSAFAVPQTSSLGSAVLPSGTTAQRDAAPVAGYVRYNITLAAFDAYDGVAWKNLALQTAPTGSAIMPVGTTVQRDAAPAAGYFRYNTTTGKFEGYGVAWGSLGGATGGGSDDAFYENTQTINNDYTLTAGKNAMSAGPITIADGVTVTVPTGATWSVV